MWDLAAEDPQSSYAGVLSIFSDKIAAGEPISVYGDGNQTRDFVHVSDVARANVLAATVDIPESAALNICTGRAVSLNDVIAVMQKLRSKNVQIHHFPKRGSDIEHSCGSPEAARAVLGFPGELHFWRMGLKIRYEALDWLTSILESPL